MMKNNALKRFMPYALPLAVGVAIFAYLQITGKYLFFYLEQQQMFLYTTPFAADLLGQVGGANKFVSYFLTQFFALPFCGALIQTLLLMATAHAVFQVLARLACGRTVWLLAWMPSLMLLFLQFQTDYFFQGTVAFTLMACAVWGYTRLPAKGWRIAVGCAGTVALFLLIGSAALPFAVCACAWELLTRRPHWAYSFLYIPVALLAGFFAVYLSWVGDYGLAFTPNFYYDAVSETPAELHALFVSLPLLMLLSAALGRWKKSSQKSTFITLVSLELLLCIGLVWKMQKKYVQRDILPTMELYYYVDNSLWNNVITFYQQHQGNFIYLNCYNMALAQQNRLGDDLFSVQQAGPYSLLVGENTTELVAGLLAEINLSMGNVGGAQKMAFTSCIASKSSVNPHQLMRMVRTHLVQREYKIAEKYLIILSQTLFYADWAKQQYNYIQQPHLIEGNTELASLRRGLRSSNHLVTPESLQANLQSVVEADTTNQRALSYLGAYYLLNKDLDSFRQFVPHYYGGAFAPALPRNFQEGLCAAVPNNVPLWRTFGVSDEVIRQFSEYEKMLTANHSNPSLAQLMQPQFGHTFWYYYMFVK